MKEHIDEMTKVLVDYTEKNHIMASHIILEDYAEQLYNAGYRKQAWISVDERLPEPNAHVLIYVFFHNQWQIVKGWYSCCDKKFRIVNSDYPSLTDIPVTHWMPLPQPPKMKGGAE